jgi:amino acid adenylation domain-containing protein
MSDAITLINRLATLGVQLRLHEDKLVTRAAPEAITPEVAALIRGHRDALLAFLRRRERAEVLRGPAIQAAGAASHPLSHAQKRLWLVDRMGTAGASYHMPAALRIDGSLDREAVAWAFSAIVQRHQVLRTVVDAAAQGQGGEPVCRVLPASAVTPDVFDLTSLPEPAREQALQETLAREAARPFDLSRDRMLRVALVVLAPRQHVLLLNMHHIASDGWSMGLLVDEFTRLYAARARGAAGLLPDPPGLPELAIQYGDHAAWQRQWLDGGALDLHLAYWRPRLAGMAPLHGLPTDFPRPAVQRHHGAMHADRLDAADAEALRALCRRHGTTLFTALQLAYAIVLSRWSHEPDICFGTPVANRTRPELEHLIGFFVNTVVLRNRIDPDRPFSASLADAATAITADLDHQSMPFDLLVDALNPERSSSHAPLVQIMFALQDDTQAPAGLHGLDGLALSACELPHRTAKFELSLNVSDTGAGLLTTWEFNTDLFRPGTVQRIAQHYLQLLRHIARAPELPIAQLDMLGAAERQELVETLNANRRPYPATSIPHVFRDQARQHAGRTALVDGAATLTYAQLEAAAAGLAARLRQRGVGDEQAIGICMDRGIDMVVAMLAVLQAGGAYLPLDLSTPAERMAQVIGDAGCRLVLCTAQRRPLLDGAGCERLVVDAAGAAPGAVSTDRPPLPDARGGRRLAYVMYTSGSTGQPKGVMVEQRGVLRLVCNPDYMRIGSGDAVAQASSSAFDASTFEIWAALLNGARLVFIDTGTLLDPPRLEAALAATGVSVLWMTTSLFNQTASLRPDLFRGLNYLLFGGEAADAQSVDRVLAAGKPRHLINIYGPTENTSFTTAFEVGQPSAQGYPIGRPVANTSCYVLGRGRELLPFGAVGELYTGGDGVARGYLGREALTRERFIADPFVPAAGATLYRTGDIVRWLPGGQLQYLARLDQQIKIRGFRVEPGEIEHCLMALPDVAEAKVLAFDDAHKGKFLAAYVVPARGSGAPQELAARWKAGLAARLPAYMVPAAIVPIDAMPLNANGKTDCSGLPPPQPHAAADAGGEPLHGEQEQALARLWCDTLQVPQVGAGDNFFALGGNSLLLMRLCSRVQQHFGIEVPFAEFFSQPTVRQQAAWLRQQAADGPEPPIVRHPPADDHPLSFAQQRLWFESLLGHGASYNVPVAARLDGALDVDALGLALDRVVQAHEVLRSRYFSQQGTGRQRIAPLSSWCLEHVDLAGRADPQAACRQMLQAEAARPFNLEQGPVFRSLLYRLSRHTHVLLLNMHHIVADGWSMHVLFDELAGLYRRIVSGEADACVAALPVQYTDYARWQRDREPPQAADRSLAFWTELLSFTRGQPLLPTDGPRYAAASYPLGERSFHAPTGLAADLRRLALDSDASLFMVLMAAYGLVVAGHAGQDRVVIGTDVAGRGRPETERLVGLFVNQLAIPAEIGAGMDFRQLLQQVRERTLAVYRHQHVPVERIVSALQLERGRTQHPLFQTKLVLQNFPSQGSAAQPAAGVSMPGVELQLMPVGTRQCKLDLMLTLAESEGGLQGQWEFNADYFRDTTLAMLEQNLLDTLQQVARHPGIAIAELRQGFERRQRDSLQAARGRLAAATRLPARAAATVAPPGALDAPADASIEGAST